MANRMQRLGYLLIGVSLMFVFAHRQSFAQRGLAIRRPAIRGVTARDVENTIDRAVDYLLLRQERDGSWDASDINLRRFNTGLSALVTMACLNAGEPVNSPAMQKAIQYFAARQPETNYEAATQILALCTANPNQYFAQIQFNVQMLLQNQHKSGGWAYDSPSRSPDPSNSQFALLALWEAQRAGLEIPSETFRSAAKYWAGIQLRSGGWKYTLGNQSPSGSMTCAGIASLIISEDALGSSDAKIGESISCCQGNQEKRRAELGVEFLGRAFAADRNPGENQYWLYYLYALERVGRLSGLRYIGEHDWYREVCEFLVASQEASGAFRGNGVEQSPVLATAYALLFLSKGKRQVVLGHLQYGEDNDWRQHRHASNNLTGHVESAWKRDLAWQTIQFEKADLRDLLEFPVLLISGTKAIRFSEAEISMLREYINQGGFIFAEGCNGDGCDGSAFESSFAALVNELVDQPLRKLPLSHPVWYADSKAKPTDLPNDFWLYGVESCCRTSIVYSPISLSCRWELFKPYGPQPELAPEIRKQLQAAVQIGVNVLSYATGRELKEKLDAVEILDNASDRELVGRGQLVLPALNHGGDPNATPKALPNLVRFMTREFPMEASSQPILINPNQESLAEFSIVYLHGREAFTFNSEQRANLRDYLINGGFLMGDAVCASAAFAESVRSELASILPEGSFVPVPADHPMLTPEFSGFDVRQVSINDPISQVGDELQRKTEMGPPVLQMLVYEDRVVAVFSPLDMSCAFESSGSTQCRGYPQRDAARIAINLILFSRFQ